MRETLLSVGIDIGTSTTQLVFSHLTIENQANPFSVPRVAITGREIVYRSAIHFTPLLDEKTIDAEGVRSIVAGEYQKAGIDRSRVETGAVIITGETARKENAAQVLTALSGFAGDFVVATAGPDLESILAARGAGADRLSEQKGSSVLHFDVGGGTSNLALYEKGELKAVTCLDIGGRLVRYGEVIDYVAPVLAGRFPGVERGSPPEKNALLATARDMAKTLAQAAGQLPEDGGLAHYATAGAAPTQVFHPDYVTFSGGVADCIWDPPENWRAYGDLGVLLGQAIGESFDAQTLLRGQETIRATVVGAGSHSTELSGSTIFYREMAFPLKNIPILKLEPDEQALPPEELARVLEKKLDWYADEDGQVQLAIGLQGFQSPGYAQVAQLADGLARGLIPWLRGGFFPIVMVERDMAKALGQALSQRISGPLLCLDGVGSHQGDYIDVGAPVAGGSVLPVIVKTLAFSETTEHPGAGG